MFQKFITPRVLVMYRIKKNVELDNRSFCLCTKALTGGVLKNFVKLTGKHLCQSLFFNKVTNLRPATLLKKRLRYTCFSGNFDKTLRTIFLQNFTDFFIVYIRCMSVILVKINNLLQLFSQHFFEGGTVEAGKYSRKKLKHNFRGREHHFRLRKEKRASKR